MPLSITLLLILLAIFGNPTRLKQKLVLLVAFLVLFTFSLPLVSKTLIRSLESVYPSIAIDQTVKADAIVILGGGVSPPYSPRMNSELSVGGDRIMLGLRLWLEGKAPLIILTGNYSDRNDSIKSEAFYTRKMLNLMGVPESAIQIEEQSRNTAEHIQYLRPILLQKNVKSILLVTSSMHMPRAMEQFANLDISVFPTPANRWITDERTIVENKWLPAAVNLYGSSNALREYMGIYYRRFTSFLATW